jgi:hypothetical protein
MSAPQRRRRRGGGSVAPERSRAEEPTATLWCLAVLLGVLLGASWFAAEVYS